jgi:toxin ParE1/3/4
VTEVIFSPEAEADLEDIAAYIAADNPARALSFVQELRARCRQIAHMPEAFPLVPDFEAAGYRRRVVRNYLVFYRIKAGAIQIVRILHGARDYESLLGGTTPDEPG